MNVILTIGAMALIVWFFVKISAPKKRTIYSQVKHTDTPSITITTSIGGYHEEPSYSEEFINKKNMSLARKKQKNTNETFPVPSFFSKNEEWVLTLKMAESRSIAFKRILPIIKELPSYKEYLEEDIPIFEVSFKKEKLHYFKKIYDDVKGLKGTQVFINGDLIEKIELSKLLRCAVDRSTANADFCYAASKWTLNPFGCHRIKTRSNGENAWYKYAYLQNNTVFIDKKKILENLINDLKKYRYCPYLDIKRVWENFLMLPDTISLEDENFAVVLTLDGQINVLNRWDMSYLRYTTFEELKEMYGSSLLSKK